VQQIEYFYKFIKMAQQIIEEGRAKAVPFSITLVLYGFYFLPNLSHINARLLIQPLAIFCISRKSKTEELIFKKGIA
jgi:hypothetical protein